MGYDVGTRHAVSVGAFVGAGFLISTHRYSDQQVPLNSKIHNSLRRPNPPILENIYYLPIKPFSQGWKKTQDME
jgi:hypothetical protein